MSSSPPPSVTFVIEDSNGNKNRVVLPGPGGTIRFAIGEPGRHSGSWRIFAPKNKSDVYIAIRSIAGYQKWSLHESGDWRFQWVTSERAQEFTQASGRIIDQWSPPPEVGPTGWTIGFSIWVREQDLVPLPTENQESLPADAVWVPPPPPEHARGVHVIIARPDQPQFELRGLVPFDGFTLADGRVVLLIASKERVTEEVTQMLDAALTQAVERAPEGDLAAAGAPRLVVVGDGPGGAGRLVWDLPVRRPASP